MTSSLFRNGDAVVFVSACLPAATVLAQGRGVIAGMERYAADAPLVRQGDEAFASVRFDPTSTFFWSRNTPSGLKGSNLSGRSPGQKGTNRQSSADLDDAARSVRAFVDLARTCQDRQDARPAMAALRRSPLDRSSGTPSVPPGERRERWDCRENGAILPVTAVGVARPVGSQTDDNTDLLAGGRNNHSDCPRALIDGVVTQEISASHRPRPPRGETRIGCSLDDRVHGRPAQLLSRPG